MNALRSSPAAVDVLSLSDLVPPATLDEARDHRDTLARLLGREREAAADFLRALADFDRRRGWERLGYSSLFAFLNRELGLSNGAAYLRLAAARLLPRFPSVEAALRQGRLCLSAVGDLSRVLTEENEAQVLPRFFGRSSREAREVAAAILPRPNPPRREVVTVVPASVPAAAPAETPTVMTPVVLPDRSLAGGAQLATSVDTALSPNRGGVPLRAREVAPTRPTRGRAEDVEPLTDDLRRLHVTVSARFLAKVSAARDGLSHALPGATTEQVLEAALDLLLEKQARAKALVKRPLKTRSTSSPASSPTATATPAAVRTSTTTPNAPSSAALPPDPRHIPAHVEREVRLRDGDRCQFPLDAGGICGSTWQVQLDHVVPLALRGPTTVTNLRCACARHNRYAAELALGPAAASAMRRRARRRH